ncbi:tryptophan--tRNA ligase [Piscirickettsia litoralis]|uniref:Tryptophan--tRNA ligase n=1 Tax=Piscirickettsia litoralis TaxID=1891921 RepID=A0ABX3A1M9_9GAMM|nr:tryptophan--tRNA ligase [Piscirickettsia litoralis]ODN42784.1 tryptophan--tRNA ligase [Piscirickettsia litoralis]
MKQEVVLTGITTSGAPHLGNYVGAIRPAIARSRSANVTSLYFLADYHSLIKAQDPKLTHQSSFEIATAWLACGLDPEQAILYRQSDIPEITELTWILTCLTAKGLMNRAHAYKAAVDENQAQNNDPDFGITMGLYSYPILMSADILAFNANKVPVGKDQVQHLEMARDVAQRFNHHYGELFTLPEVEVAETPLLSGLDGRKMSKSYGNTIPLFVPEKKLRKLIMKIKTNSLEPGEAKSTEDSTIFQIYQAFATDDEIAQMRAAFAEGIGWGDAKQKLFELVNAEIGEMRERYEDLSTRPAQIEEIIQAGAAKARTISQPLLEKVRAAVGLHAFGSQK